MTIVVLEGPDNSGKSTLAKYLCDATRALYYHPGGAPADIQAERRFLIEQQQLINSGGPLVMDRLTCVSQQVYNGHAEFDQERLRHLDVVTRSQFVFVVYCRPPNEVLCDTSNFTWRSDETEEHRQKIITRAFEWVQKYDDLMTKVPCAHYDFKDSTASEVLRTALIGALIEDPLWMEWLTRMMAEGART